MSRILLHDTRAGELVGLQPPDYPHVGIYACGPTVYSRIHIGNARPFVIFSLLKRFLEHEELEVELVMNITDVNDKIYDAARNAGVPSEQLAREMTAAYIADTDALELGRPDEEPLASETMGPIVEYIEALIDRGHAYVSGGDVFFGVRSDSDYGLLSHRRLEDMELEPHPPEPVEGSDRKRDPLDFALWKAHKDGEDTCWPSPWGPGRPGWHIECSAMAEDALGVGFDIHGGGSDLLFPHHENEAAQTRAARGEELARIWMHNGMIQFTGEKMAKSVGNIAPLHEVVERYGRDAVVMYLISGHYRQPLAFSEAALEQARANVSRIREAARRLPPGSSPRGWRSRPEAGEPGPSFLKSGWRSRPEAGEPGPSFLKSGWRSRPEAGEPGPSFLKSGWRSRPEAGEPGPSSPNAALDELRERFFEALANDFNTPEALAHLNEWVREATHSAIEIKGDAHLREMLGVLGLESLLAAPAEAPADVEALATQRERARNERDFAAADRLRDEIAAAGWEVRDGPAGFELLPR
jgi:cysteinyl-tRNA synthetase